MSDSLFCLFVAVVVVVVVVMVFIDVVVVLLLFLLCSYCSVLLLLCCCCCCCCCYQYVVIDTAGLQMDRKGSWVWREEWKQSTEGTCTALATYQLNQLPCLVLGDRSFVCGLVGTMLMSGAPNTTLWPILEDCLGL